MRVRYTLKATEEFDAAFLHYQSKNEQLADKFEARYRQAVDRTMRGPRVYPLVDRGRAGREIRLLSLDKFPYALIYESLDQEIVILGLWHEKSRGEDWSRRKA